MRRNFTTWVRRQQPSDDPRGDFIRDAQVDRQFPAHIHDLETLTTYLQQRRACNEAVTIGERLFAEFESVSMAGG